MYWHPSRVHSIRLNSVEANTHARAIQSNFSYYTSFCNHFDSWLPCLGDMEKDEVWLLLQHPIPVLGEIRMRRGEPGECRAAVIEKPKSNFCSHIKSNDI